MTNAPSRLPDKLSHWINGGKPFLNSLDISIQYVSATLQIITSVLAGNLGFRTLQKQNQEVYVS